MIKEEALVGGPKGRIEKKNQERKSKSQLIPRVLGKLEYDKTTLLHQNSRGEKKMCFYVPRNEGGGVYIVVVEKIGMEEHLMKVDKG